MNIAYNFITSDSRIRDILRNNLNISEYLNTRALLLINFTTAMGISPANPNGANLFQFISDRLLDPTNHIIFAYDQGDNNKIIGVIIFKIEPSSPSIIKIIFHPLHYSIRSSKIFRYIISFKRWADVVWRFEFKFRFNKIKEKISV